MKILFFFVMMATYANANDFETCRDPDYDTRATSCAIPNNNKEITSCCENAGVVFCGDSECVCYLRKDKGLRLKQKSGKNMCNDLSDLDGVVPN